MSDPVPALPRLISRRELAKHLDVTEDAVSSLVKRKKDAIPVYVVGKSWRFDLARVLSVLERKEVR
jgi:hypothetical protein